MGTNMAVRHPAPTQLQQLERRYDVQQPEEIAAFLATEPDITRVLLNAIEPLEQFFGESAQRILTLEEDPEDVEPVPHLFVIIRSPRSNDEVVQALETFDSTWWFENAAFSGDRLTFDVRLA